MIATDILLNDLRPTIGYLTLIGIAWSGLIARGRLLREREELERSSDAPNWPRTGTQTGRRSGR